MDIFWNKIWDRTSAFSECGFPAVFGSFLAKNSTLRKLISRYSSQKKERNLIRTLMLLTKISLKNVSNNGNIVTIK